MRRLRDIGSFVRVLWVFALLAGIAEAQDIVSTVAGTGESGFSGDGGAATAARLSQPHGVVVAPDGTIYIADYGNSRIRRVAPDGTISTFAGTTPGYSGDGGPATAARLNNPSDVALDAQGNLFIADYHNDRVRKVDPAGVITTIAGTGVSGFSGDGGPAVSAALRGPSGLGLDAAGNLFFSDEGNHRIRQVNAAGIISTVAGTTYPNNAPTFLGDGGPANLARLKEPHDVAVGPLGDLFIVDMGNNRVRRVDSHGVITTVAGGGTVNLDGVAATSVELGSPMSVVVDGSGNLLIAQSLGNRIRGVDLLGNIYTKVGDGLASPQGIALDTEGILFIADEGHNRIRKVVAIPEVIDTPGTSGPSTPGPTTPVIQSISVNLVPQGTVVSATITGNNLGSAAGVIFSGEGVSAAIASGGTDTVLPITITIAPDAPPAALSVRVVSAITISDPFYSFIVIGPPSPTVPVVGFTVDGNPSISRLSVALGTTASAVILGSGLYGATTVTFSETGVSTLILNNAADDALTILITVDPSAAVGPRSFTVTGPAGTSLPRAGFSVIAPNSDALTTIGGNGVFGFGGNTGPATAAYLNSPQGIDVDPAGNILFADTLNNRIRKISPLGSISTVAGSSSLPGSSGDGGPAIAATLNMPAGLGIDSAGNIYIALGSRVRKINSSGIITTFAGSGTWGGDDNIGDGGPAAAASLIAAYRVAADSAGNVFIADWNRIRKVNTNGIITTVAGNGVRGYGGDEGPATSAALGAGLGIALDGAGNLFIADYENHRVRKVDTSGTIHTIAGTGVAGSSGINGLAISAQLFDPTNIAVDPAGNVFFTDVFGIYTIDAGGILRLVYGTHNLGPIALDHFGNIVISDGQNNKILKLTRVVEPTPVINSISATTGVAGSRLTATITGSNLFGATGVVFSGSGIRAVILPGATDTSVPIEITISSSAAGSLRTISLATANRLSAPFNGFTVTVDPTARMTGISPAYGSAGGVAFATITGTNLGGAGAVAISGSGVSAVLSGGGTATTLFVTFNILAGASPNLRTVQVTTPAGIASFSGFLVLPPVPVITSISPTSGTQDTTLSATISGSHLSNVDTVTVSGTGVTPQISNIGRDDNNLPVSLAISPEAAAGPRTITVANRSLISAPRLNAFTVNLTNLPIVKSVNPSIALRGTTFSAIIAGRNLATTTAVTISGTGVSSVLAGAATETTLPISITIAFDAMPGARTISVTTLNGSTQLTDALTVAPDNVIRIISVSPVATSAGSTFSAVISGRNLGGATGVSFSGIGVTGTITSSSPTSVVVSGNIEGNAATGLRSLTLTTPGGSSDDFLGLTVTSAPRLTLTRTIAGTGLPGYSGDDTFVQLNYPTGVAVNAAGNLLIADSENHRIRLLSPPYTVNTIAGTGSAGFSGDGAPAIAAKLSYPQNVAVDSVGNIFIADTANHRIRKISLAGTISTVAGNGAPGFSGDSGPATSAQLSSPNNVSVDAAGNLYIADTANHRIRKVDTAGTITTVAGTGNPGFNDDNVSALLANLWYPGDAVVDAGGNLFIADSLNRRIRKVSTSGVITTFAGTGTAGPLGDGGPSTDAHLELPTDLFIDSAGNLFVADYLGFRVRKISPGGVISTVAGNGTAGFSGDGGMATAAQLAGSYGVGFDASGNLFIADLDNNRVRKVDTAGVISTIAGTGTAGFNGDGTPAQVAQMRSASVGAVDGAGNVFFSDPVNNRVRKVTPDGRVTNVAGSDLSGFSGDGGPAVGARLNNPQGLVFDGLGNLFVADTANHRIRRISTNGIITTIAGTGIAGFSGDGGPASLAKISAPSALTIDGAGNILFVDSNNYRIRKITPSGIISTIAGTGQFGVPGDTGLPFGQIGDGGPAIAARLLRPTSVAVDSSGNIFVVDSEANRVRKIDIQGIITTVVGTGVADFSGDDGPATVARLNQPSGLAFDRAGNLYIQDGGNRRIRMVNSAGIITTILEEVTGAFALSGNGDILFFRDYRIFELAFTTTLPKITGISPFNGNQGTSIPATITGTTLSGATGVTFSGAGVTATLGAGASDATLPVTINIAADAVPGPRTFTVTAAAGTSDAFSAFTVTTILRQPQITGISATRGIVGTIVSATISGDDLLGITAVTFSGTGVTAAVQGGGTATSVSVAITIAGDAAVGIRTLTATTAGGTSTAFNGFLVARPTITSISPPRGMAGFVLPGVITGTNLTGVTSINFSGAGVSAVIGVGATDTIVPVLITVQRAATPGVRTVTLTTTDATSEDFNGFTVVPTDNSGMIVTIAGNGSDTFSGDDGLAILAGIRPPARVAKDKDGNILIADRLHSRVRKVTPDGIMHTVAGNDEFGPNGDGGPATSARLGSPQGLAVDSAGNLFIATNFNAVRKVSPDGIISTFAGNGANAFSGDGGPAVLAGLDNPQGMAFDAAGNLYIADTRNNRVRRVSPEGIISTVAGNGAQGFGGDGFAATAAALNQPVDVAVDSLGNLFIADLENNRIRKVSTNGIITTIAGTGIEDFNGDGNPAAASQFRPSGVDADAAGNVFIADSYNHRIRKINSAGIMTTVAGRLGGADFDGDGGPSTSAQLWSPVDVIADESGALFIADLNNRRIRQVSYALAVASVLPSSIVQGQTMSAVIRGSGLLGASNVTFSGTGVTATILSGGTDNWLPITITAAGGAELVTRTVTVTTPYGVTDPFTGVAVRAPATPLLNAISASIPGLSQVIAPYYGMPFTLTINGQDFQSGATVSIGGIDLPTTLVSSSRLTAEISASALAQLGTQNIRVTNPGGMMSDVLGLRVAVRGNFNSDSSISIGDALVCALTVGGLTRPLLAVSVGDLNLNGSVNIGDCLSAALFAGRLNPNLAAPTIASVSPTTAVAGTLLTIAGTGLAPGSSTAQTRVLFPTGSGTTRVAPTSASPTTLTVVVPANAVSGPIQVYRMDTPIGGPEFPLTISGGASPLVLTGANPYFGVAVGGSINLTGMGFSSNAANNIVRFTASSGTVVGTVASVNASQTVLGVTVPAGAVCGPVTVSVGADTSNARMVTMPGSSCANAVQLVDVWGGGTPGDTLVLEGAGFNVAAPGANVVQFAASGGGTVVAPVLAAGGTQLHVRIPATAVAGDVTVTVGGVTSNAMHYAP